MNQDPNNPGPIPTTGLVVSIQAKSGEVVAATVVFHSAKEIKVKLARTPSQAPFQSSEEVRIKYWDEGTVAYHWNGEVLEVDGDREMTIAVQDRGIAVQRRRAYRAALEVPLTITVMDAADAALEPGTTVSGRTENVSTGGLLFETDLPLGIGDKVEIRLEFTSSDQVSAVGWVVRATPVEQSEESRRAIALEFLQIEEDEQSRMLYCLAHSASRDD